MLASAWPSAAKIRPKVKYSYYQTRDFQRGKVIRFFLFFPRSGIFSWVLGTHWSADGEGSWDKIPQSRRHALQAEGRSTGALLRSTAQRSIGRSPFSKHPSSVRCGRSCPCPPPSGAHRSCPCGTPPQCAWRARGPGPSPAAWW